MAGGGRKSPLFDEFCLVWFCYPGLYRWSQMEPEMAQIYPGKLLGSAVFRVCLRDCTCRNYRVSHNRRVVDHRVLVVIIQNVYLFSPYPIIPTSLPETHGSSLCSVLSRVCPGERINLRYVSETLGLGLYRITTSTLGSDLESRI